MNSNIAIVGGKAPEQTALRELFALAGIETRPAPVLNLDRVVPDVLVITGVEALDVLAEARQTVHLVNVPILACVPMFPSSTGDEALAGGATDVLLLPASAAVAGARLRNLLALGQQAAQRALSAGELAGNSAPDAMLLALQAAGPDPWRDALRVVCEATGFDRASIVAHVEGSEFAYVVAASDEGTQKFALSMRDYPEFERAFAQRQPVWIDDVRTEPLMQRVLTQLPEGRVRSVAVMPAIFGGRMLGVLALRGRTPGLGRLPQKRADLEWLAGVVATYLQFGPVVHALRDETHRLSRAHYEAERRLHGIDSLRRHFEAGSDGVLILDEEARILYVNRAAESLTGFARDGLLGGHLVDLVVPAHRDRVAGAVSQVMRQQNVQPFDLDVVTTGAHPVTVSVTTSTALAQSGAAVLTFRDVTVKRALERELKSTKDFLERLINSTVDAIIVADVEGKVFLFNRGAERLLGYAADEVVGHAHLAQFYRDDVLAHLVRMLRSTSHGGLGRLEPTRREVKTKQGELRPISMTAAMVYEQGEEVATVFILTDLSERIRIEHKLLAAQQQLAQSEKHALVAQLAGTAAHELNQPLTAVLGYAELLRRQVTLSPQGEKSLGTIISEAERMADIVRKIGRLTKFETKAYVGNTTIVDLDASSRAETPPPLVGVSSAGLTQDDGAVTDVFDEELHTQEFFAARGAAFSSDELPPPASPPKDEPPTS
ncbi:MAG: PAS domain S-box protein [Myxococcales bacterium]|nr:PAS domain S-box protein [Myxococcales bacterium]